MADKPIIFSAPMVQALLDRRKTQTRRLLKQQSATKFWLTLLPSGIQAWFCDIRHKYGVSQVISPNYAVGDRLWVREAWRAMDGQDKFSGAQIGAACLDAGYKSAWSPIQYEADGVRYKWVADPHTFGTKAGRYRHARFMPRWASRLTLTVTDVRVQRLRDISDADAVAEGVEVIRAHNVLWAKLTPENLFAALWDSLHGPDAWDTNPWVWALTFDVQHGNIDRIEGHCK